MKWIKKFYLLLPFALIFICHKVNAEVQQLDREIEDVSRFEEEEKKEGVVKKTIKVIITSVLLLGVIYYIAQVAYWKIQLNNLEQEIHMLHDEIGVQKQRKNKYLKKMSGNEGFKGFFSAVLETPKEIVQGIQETTNANLKMIELNDKRKEITKKLKQLGF
ncbi:MAG: hypothetical protein AAF380_01075 [Bacteroidota bacterium]